MAYQSGFSDVITYTDGGVTKTIVTLDDYTYGSSRTEIAVKTRGSEVVRYIPGMLEKNVSFTVYAGTDPDDSANVDAYTFFKNMHTNKSTKTLTIEGESNRYICTAFEASSPVDGLKSASVTLKISGAPVSTSSSSSSSSND